MKTFTFFALMICAILAMVSAVPYPKAPSDKALEAAETIPVDDMLEGAESRGYGYNRYRGGGGGGGRYGYGYGRYYGR